MEKIQVRIMENVGQDQWGKNQVRIMENVGQDERQCRSGSMELQNGIVENAEQEQ